MRICSKCNFKNEDNAVFCENCGVKLDEASMGNNAKLCYSCGTKNANNAVFCENCGVRLNGYTTEENNAIICPACGTKNEDNAKFCERCGAQLERSKKCESSAEVIVDENDKIHKPNKVSKVRKIIFLEIICIAVVVTLFFVIGNMKYGAEAIAERYFEAYSARDWNTMYSLLDLPEGTFMNESQFVELMEKEDAINPSSYTIRDKRSSETNLMHEFEVKYSIPGENAETMDLTLVRNGKKECFFFDEWRVSSTGVVVKDYPISVPTGSRVTVDGIELTDPSSSKAGMDSYSISAFDGTHELSVAMPWCAVYTAQFDTSEETSLTVDMSDIAMTEDGEKALKAKAQQDLQKWYSAGISEADYSEVMDLFSKDAVDEYKSEYSKLVVALKNAPDSNYAVNGINFFNFDYELDSNIRENGKTVKVAYEYTTNYTYDNERHTTSFSTDALMTVSYVCENDTWKIQSLTIV